MVHAFPMLELCSRDVTTVKITYTRGSIQELTVILAYLPYDSDETPPSEGLRESLTLWWELQLIIGCDANANHNIWETMDISP
jgi:hypothetical protein